MRRSTGPQAQLPPRQRCLLPLQQERPALPSLVRCGPALQGLVQLLRRMTLGMQLDMDQHLPLQPAVQLAGVVWLLEPLLGLHLHPQSQLPVGLPRVRLSPRRPLWQHALHLCRCQR